MENANCKKKSYNTDKDAISALNKIKLTSTNETIPLRFYECKYCGKYHLTSKTETKYKNNLNIKNQRINERVKKRELSFINREANYWMKKFGIDGN